MGDSQERSPCSPVKEGVRYCAVYGVGGATYEGHPRRSGTEASQVKHPSELRDTGCRAPLMGTHRVSCESGTHRLLPTQGSKRHVRPLH